MRFRLCGNAFIMYVHGKKSMRRKVSIPSKFVFKLSNTNLLGVARKMARAKKRQDQNRQLLAVGRSIFAGRRRRRYISAR